MPYKPRSSKKQQHQREWYRKNHKKVRERRRQAHVRKKYGLEPAAYQALYEAQNGRCKICGESTKLVVDHDHVTGRVRGLLCDPCNKGLGFFRDDPARLEKARECLVNARNGS